MRDLFKRVRLHNLVLSFTKEVKIMDHLNDEDERKILVEGCEHCRQTGWVVVGIAAMCWVQWWVLHLVIS